MRALLDACVLYPTTLRGMLNKAAKANLFEPLFSDRILEEWARAAERNFGEEGARIARVEIALLRSDWPHARSAPDDLHPNTPDLPDENDLHVVSTALHCGADTIITHNLRDFPTRLLSPLGIAPRSPDSVFLELLETDPKQVAKIAQAAFEDIQTMPGAPNTERALLKKAGLPRLGKALERLN